MNKHSFCRHLLSVALADFQVTHPEFRLADFGATKTNIGQDSWHIEGPQAPKRFHWDTTACCAWLAKSDALAAYEVHLERENAKPKGWVTEVFAQGEWVPNGIVWPDEESALEAGRDLLSRWFVPTDYRAVPTDKEPNRPTWAEQVAQQGLPAKSVEV